MWCSADDDPDLDNLSIEDYGRYCKLGAQTKEHGTDGVLVIRPPARTVLAKLQLPDFDSFIAFARRLPNVHIDARSDNGSGVTDVTVTFANWSKFQGDYSGDRVRAHRAGVTPKKRRDETRRNTPVVPRFDDFQKFWNAYPNKTGKGAAERAWENADGRTLPEVDVLLAAITAQRKTDGWLKDNGKFIPHPSTWLNQRRWEDQPPQAGDKPRPHFGPRA